MKSEILSQERNVVVVKSEFEASEVDRGVAKTVKELSNKASIKGFRKGHVPRKTLELYFGKNGIYKEALEKLAQQALESIVTEYELDLIAEPKGKFGEMTEGAPLEMEFTFEIRPEVSLPDLSTLTAERVVYKTDEEEVEAAFRQVMESNAELVTLDEDRPIAADDIVSVEYSSSAVEKDGSLTELEKDKNSTIHLSAETLRKEIREAIVGKKLAEEFFFEIKIEDDYPDKRMAGTVIRYDMEVLQLMERVVPEPTDEKIKELSKGQYETAEALKAELRRQIEANAKERSDASLRDSAVKALSAAAEVDVPEAMIDRQYNAMRREQEGQVQRDLKRSLDDYLTFNNLSVEEYDGNLRKRAEDVVRNTLVLDALAEKDEISFTSDELNEEIIRLANSIQVNPQELADSLSKNRDEFTSVAMRVRTRNTMNHLAANVQVSEVEPPAAEVDDGASDGKADDTAVSDAEEISKTSKEENSETE